MLVAEPDLDGSIWPGGGQGAGGQDPVRPHSVPPAGLVGGATDAGAEQPGGVEDMGPMPLEHSSTSLDKVSRQSCGHHHCTTQCCDDGVPLTLWPLQLCTPGHYTRDRVSSVTMSAH